MPSIDDTIATPTIGVQLVLLVVTIGLTDKRKKRMNIRDLKYLLAVTKFRNFTAAANYCHVSQPTLSGQIKKLEETLGVQLFERTNKKVIPTTVGKQIAVSATRVLNEVEQIKAIAESSSDPLSGRFRLGAFPTLASYIFPAIVQPIKSAMPNLKLVLIEEKTAILIKQLQQGDIDAALLALPVHNDLFSSQKLFEDYFCLAVHKGHELSSLTAIDQNAILNRRLLLLEEGHCMRDQALDICSLTGTTEEADIRATSLETLRQMVRAGTGITLMPEIAVQHGGADICYIPFKSPRPKRTIALFWRKTLAKTSVIEELVKIIKNPSDRQVMKPPYNKNQG